MENADYQPEEEDYSIPNSVHRDMLKAMRPILIAEGYIHISEVDPIMREAQKCYTRDGLKEFVAKHWPDMALIEKDRKRCLTHDLNSV